MSGFIKRATAAASAAVITLTATGCSNRIFKERRLPPERKTR